MPRRVVITTGSRLHFGLLANAREGSRCFGGAGLMLDRPGFTLAATVSERDVVDGSDIWKERAEQYLKTCRCRTPAETPLPCCHLEIRGEIPPHVGLGSGTQLGMAVAQAAALLAGNGTATAAELAARVGRGTRSALGIYGFQRGGFLIEAGKAAAHRIGPLLAQAVFPDTWRMILVRPRAFSGLSGAAELAAFAALEPMPADTTAHLCRILLMELLPSVLEADFESCGEALYEYGRTVGTYFAPTQKGVYAHPDMASLADHLRQRGVHGVGQTSWGPTLFVLCENERQAAEIDSDLAHSAWENCDRLIAAPLNSGAAIEIRDHD